MKILPITIPIIVLSFFHYMLFQEHINMQISYNVLMHCIK